MGCFLPFSNMDISLFVLRPTVVLPDDLIEALKSFSFFTKSLGCLQTSVFKSIHGNMIIWCGGWTKGSSQNKELLNEALLPMLSNLSSMAIVIGHSFFDVYGGDSIDGLNVAKICTGDTISMISACANSGDINDLSYACLAIFKSHFGKMEGVKSGACLKCQGKPRVATIYVWKSLHFCYSWLLNSDHRKSTLPFLDNFSLDIKYDVFRVVHVGDDNVLNFQCLVPEEMLENEEESI